MAGESARSFATPEQLEDWLRDNHASERELWVRIFKKASGRPTVSWDDCVVAAIAWGWIDGLKRKLDNVSYLQRLTPRRPKSSWSKRNRAHVERLIAEGRMQPAGMACVEAAKADGRWERAYAGSADMVIPDDFLRELKKHPEAEAFYGTLTRRNLYVIYHRLHSARREATRQKRIAAIIDKLSRHESLT